MKFTAALRLSLLAFLILISSVGYGQETYQYYFTDNPFNGGNVKKGTSANLGGFNWSIKSDIDWLFYQNGLRLSYATGDYRSDNITFETTDIAGTIHSVEVTAYTASQTDKKAPQLTVTVGDCNYGTADLASGNINTATTSTFPTDGKNGSSSGKITLKFTQTKGQECGIVVCSIKITYGSALTISEDSDNTTTINDNNGKTTSVQVARTFTADGGWYTLCLPFSLTKTQIENVFGSGTDVEAMTGIQTDNESVTAIEFSSVDVTNAGTAYIVKPTQTTENPTFTSVTLSNNAPTATNVAGYQFIGVYTPTTISADGYHRLLSGTDGLTLKKAAADNTQLKATRGYFIFPNDNTQGAKIYIGGTTSINGIAVDTDATAADAPTYTLQGIKVGGNGQLPKGIYIRQGKKILVR